MTLQKRLNIALAALLIVVVSATGIIAMTTHFSDFGYAVLVTYRQKLPENPDVFDGLKARISSITSTLNTYLPFKAPLQRMNARLQMAMGKQQLSFGGSQMVTTTTGQLYDLMDDTATTQATRQTTLAGMKKLHDKLAEQGIPMLYGYAHTTLYDGVELPSGITDDNNAVADEIVASLRGYGIETLDSREVAREAGLTIGEEVYRTDAHWTPRNAFAMYTALVALLNEKTSVKADRAAADFANFDSEVLPRAHISDIGKRLGADVVAPDDFELITPKFETNIHREIMQDKRLVPSDGAFEDVVLDKSMLPAAKGVEVTNCYNYYGQHPDVVYYTNERAPQGRLLVVKDSFGTPVSSFLALAVRDVCAIDLRKTTKTVEEYVESFKPDAVVFVQCQEVMRGQNFVFVDAK